MTVNPIQQNSHQKPARPSAPVNGAIFMGLMLENSITIFAENSITFDSRSILPQKLFRFTDNYPNTQGYRTGIWRGKSSS